MPEKRITRTLSLTVILFSAPYLLGVCFAYAELRAVCTLEYEKKMPSDFTQTSISMSSKRTYVSPIATLANFSAVVAAFLADTTIGLSKKEKKTESYKVPVKFFDTDSKQKGQVYLTVDNTTSYNDAMNMLVADTDLSNSIAGAGSDSTEDETEALWSVRVSCELNGDTFSVTFNREYATIT